MVWNPQTRKLTVSNQNPLCAAASRIAADRLWLLVCAALFLPASADASGMMISDVAASTRSAFSQPKWDISPCPNGSMTNWPNEPPAPTSPSAALRFSGGEARPTTPITTPKPEPLSPRPTSTPAEISNAIPVVEYAISMSPSA